MVKPGECRHGRTFVYVYKGSSSQAVDRSSGEFSVDDRFTYRLFDSSGALSTLGHVSLTVVSGMRAVSAQSQNASLCICQEDTENVVDVYVENAGGIGGNVAVVLATVPKHGSLLRISDNSYLEADDAVTTSCRILHRCMASINLPKRVPAEKWGGDVVNEVPQTEDFSFYSVRLSTPANTLTWVSEIFNFRTPTTLLISDVLPESMFSPLAPRHTLMAPGLD